ncbi:hypothetical protein CDAR_555411 [Caerostris darwini]|uniref:Uncharacterized protein n=1 Tax=Caerostris darwini TaxID=1538125 RepID=A0AAV4QBI0_9ARAC|nr:hypothetical protein CDAR_555411 [Caerostris darwini]
MCYAYDIWHKQLKSFLTHSGPLRSWLAMTIAPFIAPIAPMGILDSGRQNFRAPLSRKSHQTNTNPCKKKSNSAFLPTLNWESLRFSSRWLHCNSFLTLRGIVWRVDIVCWQTIFSER